MQSRHRGGIPEKPHKQAAYGHQWSLRKKDQWKKPPCQILNSSSPIGQFRLLTVGLELAHYRGLKRKLICILSDRTRISF